MGGLLSRVNGRPNKWGMGYVADLLSGATNPFREAHMREWPYFRIHVVREMQDCRKNCPTI